MEYLSLSELTQIFKQFCNIGPRWCGTDEEQSARQYIEESFRNNGLECWKESFEYLSYSPKDYSFRMTSPNEVQIRCLPLTYGANTSSCGITGELLPIGEGKEPDYRRVESEGVSVKGKIVLSESIRSYLVHPLAEDRGAIGFVIATNSPGGSIRLGTATMGRVAKIPSISISYEDAQFLRAVSKSDFPVMELIQRATVGMKSSYNVITRIPGISHIKRKIVVVAHYDSYWAGPHALDNATGLVGLLMLAKAILKMNLDLTVELVAVSAEELGAIGSRAYLNKHEDEMLTQAVACVNLDTFLGSGIGTEPEIHVSSTLAGLVQLALKETGLKCPRWFMLPSSMLSDHVPFVERGIPSMYLTSSLPAYYHTSDDTTKIINFKKLKLAIITAVNIISSLSRVFGK